MEGQDQQKLEINQEMCSNQGQFMHALARGMGINMIGIPGNQMEQSKPVYEMSDLQNKGYPLLEQLELTYFKTQQCTNQNPHNHKQCQYYHSSKDRRRLGNFYSSDICEYAEFDNGSNCPSGDKCAKSHNKVEQLYQPDKYKTKFCTLYPNNCSSCEYGPYCSFAHTEQEIQIDLIHNFEQDEDFFIFYYKTVQCPFNYIQHDRSLCVYAHNWQDFRRKPHICNYDPEPCPFWKPNDFITKYENGCPSKFECTKCHGWKEFEYHPKNYRTKPCQGGNQCQKGRSCPYYHNPSEKRQIPMYVQSRLFRYMPRNRFANNQAGQNQQTLPKELTGQLVINNMNQVGPNQVTPAQLNQHSQTNDMSQLQATLQGLNIGTNEELPFSLNAQQQQQQQQLLQQQQQWIQLQMQHQQQQQLMFLQQNKIKQEPAFSNSKEMYMVPSASQKSQSVILHPPMMNTYDQYIRKSDIVNNNNGHHHQKNGYPQSENKRKSLNIKVESFQMHPQVYGHPNNTTLSAQNNSLYYKMTYKQHSNKISNYQSANNSYINPNTQPNNENMFSNNDLIDEKMFQGLPEYSQDDKDPDIEQMVNNVLDEDYKQAVPNNGSSHQDGNDPEPPQNAQHTKPNSNPQDEEEKNESPRFPIPSTQQ